MFILCTLGLGRRRAVDAYGRTVRCRMLTLRLDALGLRRAATVLDPSEWARAGPPSTRMVYCVLCECGAFGWRGLGRATHR